MDNPGAQAELEQLRSELEEAHDRAKAAVETARDFARGRMAFDHVFDKALWMGRVSAIDRPMWQEAFYENPIAAEEVLTTDWRAAG